MGKYENHHKTRQRNRIPNFICRINPDIYSIRVTRSISKILYSLENFVVVEVYRCMPLLGDEHKVPNWQVHFIKYAIVFKEKK